MKIRDLLVVARERGASDLHLTAESAPILRVDGMLVPLDGPPLSRNAVLQILYEIIADEQKERFSQTRELDFSLDVPGLGRFRVNVFEEMRGHAAVFRLVPDQIRSLDELGMPPLVKNLCLTDRGLILVTGPTGSGKTTTLAAMIDYINTHRQGHIITVEDPIEFVHQPKNCLIRQREVGAHTHSFANALRAALREDPDVIFVGEMRDHETISAALTAAETGHLVLSTLHTNNAAQTVNRIVDVFAPDQQEQIRVQLADVVLALMAQTLLPAAEGTGRVAAVELLVATPAIRNLIRERKTYQIGSAIQTGAKEGMQTLDQSLQQLVKAGRVTIEEARKRAADPQAVAARPGVSQPPAAVPAPRA